MTTQGSIIEKVKQNQPGQQAPKQPQQAQQVAPVVKEDFRDPLSVHAESMANRASSADRMAKASVDAKTTDMIDKVNEAMSTQNSLKEDMKEFDEQMKISDEDVALAEQVIFRGYAELEVTMANIPGHRFTLCTTSAEDMSLIDEILFDMVKAKENEKGDVDLPSQHVQTMRNALFLALGFKGVDGKDFCDEPIYQMMTIKKAVIKIKEYENAGDLPKMNAMSADLKRSVKYRAIRIKRYPTPVVDFLANKKFEFDQKMYTIMMSEKILPKSSGQSQGTQERSSSSQGENSSSGQ